MLAALFHRGVRGLLAYARTQRDVALRDEGYVSSCELCHALRAQLIEESPEHPELQPVGFYRELAGTWS